MRNVSSISGLFYSCYIPVPDTEEALNKYLFNE